HRSPLRGAPAPAVAFAGQRIPFHTSVWADAPAPRLGTPLLSLADLLSSFRTERETGQLARRGE
ncbi:MAG: hypothetical protein AAGA65_03810, partial [Actinomycetota bacterium]